ncbi:hypothetical protein J4416_02000 [Candidatus Pacearchaeota archaeon]|nr:hypothetical protein [Candidatus Pacearchaeota archaeon]
MHKGRNLKDGYVHSTEFWIINTNNKYCGRISLRHKLNDFLSKHGGHIGYDESIKFVLKKSKKHWVDKGFTYL